MQSGNSSSQNNRSEVNLFRKILFALACVAAFVFFVVLVQGKHRSDNALTGDLLTNGTFHTQEVPHSAFSSFFDYLGGVVYLFPLLVVFFGYRFFISRRGSLFRFDPFAISVVILGINVLIIGFSSIFDLVGRTGGVLGIFLNRNIVGLLPSSIEPILPIALVIAGICLVSGKSPLWFIDAIGSLCGRFIFRGEEKEQFEENKAEIKQTADNTEDLLKGFGSLDDSSFGPNEDGIKVIPKHQEKIEEKQSIKASLKALLSKFNKQKSNKKVQSSSLQRHEPSFGGRNSEESLPVAENITLKATSSNPFKDTVVDSLDGRRTDGETFAGFEKKDSKNTLFNESSAPAFSKDPFASTGAFENKVPAFNENKGSSTPSSFGRIDNQKSAEDKRADEPLHYLGPSMLSRAPGTSAPSWGTQEESNSSGGTSSTYITGMNSTASSASDAVVSESSCIISGTAVKDSRQNITSVKSTIVTKMNPPKTESLENEDRAIYRAGAQHLEPVKTVGSPSRHSEVSTVIIRTSTTPKVKLSADNSSMQGGYSQSSSIISREDERASMANPYEQSTNVAEDDDNIISFSDLVKPVENDSSIEVKNLSSDFVRNDQGKLNTPRSAPINESDEKYELYSRATRGVISSQTQPSGMSNKNSSIYAEANNQVPSAANSYSESQNTQIQQHSYNQTSAQYQSNTADTAPKTYTSSSASSNVPFESMSSLNGTVPNHLSDRPRAPVGSIPKVTYARATETIPSKEYGTWRPSLGLLTRSADSNQYDDEAFRVEVAQKAERINQFMKDYNVKGSVSNMALGPVITRYDVNLAPGVKSASLASLETDLQRYLITNKINIIPAVSSFVGIEVPNIKRKLITLGDVATTQTFTNTKAILPMCVGVDTLGNSVVADLASAPHLLIAGTTGSGKSAGLNSMLISLLLARSPAELRLIMVDPKTVEFTQYQGLPHLLCPIITDPMSAASALAWLIKEQERRYKLLAKLRVSKISQCNDLIRTKNANNEVVYDPLWTPDMGGEAPILKPLPYLVLVIDEYADLAAVASSTGRKGEKSMEGMIGRLAGKARAAGIHIILATQTPRAEIITGTIRANMPSRIAYTVQNGNESRIILDETGAENLLGNGDMLIKYQGLRNTEKFRAHGPFASNHDVESVVKSWIEYAGDPEYVDGVTEGEDEEETAEIQSPQEPVNKLDEKFDEVVAHARVFCTTTNRALSVSELQTTFSFGYNRAKKIHRQLQKEGIIDEKGFLVSHGY